MESPLLSVTSQFLDSLEQIQTELLEQFQIKRQALIRGDVAEMENLQHREQEYARRLQEILAFRNRILGKAREGREERVENLEQLATRNRRLPGWDAILERIQQSNRTQAQLRQESWVHWIISHRCYNHYTEVLDLIAHQGNREPVYSNQPHKTVTGGTFLDASV